MTPPIINYRSLGANEAGLLIQCIRNVYGDSYPIDAFYDENFISAQIKAGLLHSELALNEAGEAIGNICTHLEQPGDYTADGSVTMVDSRYRGLGVLGELGIRSTDIYRKLGICGIHIYALAWHDIIQKQAAAGGAVEMGILPAYFSRDIVTEGFDHKGFRLGSVMMYLPLTALPYRVVFLPTAYCDILTGCYQSLKGQRMLRQADLSVAVPEQTFYHVEYRGSNGHQRMRIDRIGRDCYRLLEDFVCKSKQLQVSYIDIPLDNPHVDTAVDSARAMGFFFGGLLLERCGCDRLRMQKMAADLFDPKALNIASNRGGELLAFMLGDMP